MLLRRVLEHLRTQNWFAVGLDFLIVVLGVFLGLQAQDWANSRSQRASEVQLLLALREDLRGGVPILDEKLGRLREESDARRALVRYANDDTARLPDAELHRLIRRGVFGLTELSIPQPAIDEMKASGSLSQLGSAALRRRLSELDVAIADLATYTNDAREMYANHSDPFLVRHYDMRGIYIGNPDPRYAAVSAMFGESRSDSDFRALKSREFRNILFYRETNGVDRLTRAESIRAIYIDLIRLIDARLAELGAQRPAPVRG